MSRLGRNPVLYILLLAIILANYQNCASQFEAIGSKLSDNSSSDSNNNNNNKKSMATMDEFKACYAVPVNLANGDNLAACLNNRINSADYYKASVINTCLTTGNVSEMLLSACMSKQNNVIADHRNPSQIDIDACAASAGNAGIADCLDSKGLGGNYAQTDINTCITNGNLAGVEKCLRKAGLISRRPVLMQSEAKLCQVIGGDNTKLAYCLQNADLAPASLTQANVDTCITDAGFDKVIRCLRVNNFLNKAVMQAHLNVCGSIGEAQIATCLDNNGLAPVEAAAGLTALQAEITECIGRVMVAGLAKCLRTKGILSSVVLQPHAASCADVAGLSGVFNCLNANFVNLPMTLTQAAIDTCVTSNSGTIANNVKCLAAAKILPDVPTQASVNACIRFAGQAGVAACHDASGLLLPGMAQAHFEACINTVGLPNVESCLYSSGAIGSYSRLIGNVAPANVFSANCMGCHNAVNMAGGMNILNHASVLGKIAPGNPNGSVLYQRITSNNPNMRMPANAPALNSALIERVRVWILQGARNN